MVNKKSTQTGHTQKEKGNMRKSQKAINKKDIDRDDDMNER